MFCNLKNIVRSCLNYDNNSGPKLHILIKFTFCHNLSFKRNNKYFYLLRRNENEITYYFCNSKCPQYVTVIDTSSERTRMLKATKVTKAPKATEAPGKDGVTPEPTNAPQAPK